MNKSSIIIYLLGAFLWIGNGGCSDDVQEGETEDTDSTDSDVDDANGLASLSDTEKTAFCQGLLDETIASTQEVLPESGATCQMMGVSAAKSVAQQGGTAEEWTAACTETVQLCDAGGFDAPLADSDQTTTVADPAATDPGMFCDGIVSLLGDCDASPTQITNCYGELLEMQLSSVESYLGQVPACDELSLEYLESDSETALSTSELSIPTACAVVFFKCPELIDSLM